MSQVKNLFIEQNEAQRYNQHRPVYHHLLANQLDGYFNRKLNKILDVACGTGHSTGALSKICHEIIGCDISEAMLNEARKNSNLKFILSKAEQLPFNDSEFDYLNISMAFQWLNQIQFLNEARRVLKKNGILGIDNYGFSGKMIGSDSFTELFKAFDYKLMKPAARNKNFPDEADLENSYFQLMKQLNYDHEVIMNKHQFINYLMTRSNYLDLSTENRAKVQIQMNDYFSAAFQNDKKSLYFFGSVKLYAVLR